jgi:perosamine synthetase
VFDIHDSIGYNFKFTELQACIGIEQMKKLPTRVERKKEILMRYKDNLNNQINIKFFKQDLNYTTPWFIDIIAEKRDGLINYLKSNNIGSRLMYPPINKQKAYNVVGEHPISNIIGDKGLWLPSANQLTNDTIDDICNVINRFYQNHL